MATPKQLYIPGKNNGDAHQPGYGTDMRTIEIFNPINKLVAGSGVTLTPSSGEGPQVEISASGGGGGSVPVAFGVINAGPESINPTNGNWFPLGLVMGADANGPGLSPFPIYSDPGTNAFTSNAYQPVFNNVWFTIVGPGSTVSFLPYLQTPSFTGASTLTFSYYYWAVSTDFSNGMMYQGETAVPPLTSQQVVLGDLTSIVTYGTDLTLTAGTGESGNGYVSGGSLLPYFAGVSGSLIVPPGVTF